MFCNWKFNLKILIYQLCILCDVIYGDRDITHTNATYSLLQILVWV